MTATDGPRRITDGELWSREQLTALLAASFRPYAIARFVVASQRRVNRVRAARPELARRELAWIAAGFAAWLVLAANEAQPFRRRMRSGLAGWASTGLMLDWHLGMVETEDGRARNLGVADAVTLLRAWLVPAVADAASPALCVLGFATDVLDGRLARATEVTRLGRDLEGLVDAAFAVAALRGAVRHRLISARVAIAEALRLLTGVAYASAVYFGRAEPPARSVLRAGRMATPLRAGGIVVAGTGRAPTGSALLFAGSVAGLAPIASSLVHAIRMRPPQTTDVRRRAHVRLH